MVVKDPIKHCNKSDIFVQYSTGFLKGCQNSDVLPTFFLTFLTKFKKCYLKEIKKNKTKKKCLSHQNIKDSNQTIFKPSIKISHFYRYYISIIASVL